MEKVRTLQRGKEKPLKKSVLLCLDVNRSTPRHDFK